MNAAQQTKRKADETLRRAGQNPVIRNAAVDAARRAGNAAGVVRGGVHAVEGVLDGVNFVSRLVDPLDGLKSPPGQSAVAQLDQS